MKKIGNSFQQTLRVSLGHITWGGLDGSDIRGIHRVLYAYVILIGRPNCLLQGLHYFKSLLEVYQCSEFTTSLLSLDNITLFKSLLMSWWV